MSDIQDYYNLSQLRSEHIAMLRLTNQLGRELFAPRAFDHDRDATFPTANYDDLRAHGFLKLVIPRGHGGLGFSATEYAMIGAEIGKHCGATALTFNMHQSSMLWSDLMYHMPTLSAAEKEAFRPMRERQFKRVVDQGVLFSQPISEGGNNWTSKPIQTQCDKVAGGYRINGMKKFASLADHCDYYAIVCTEHFENQEPRHEDTMMFAVHKNTPGVSVVGDWDPVGMRGTTSRDLSLKDVFVTTDDLMMPAGVFIKTLPHWPHLMAMLSPTYMGIAQGAYDYTVRYLRGQIDGLPPIDRRIYPTKRAAVGRMYQQLSQMRALWTQAIQEIKPFPSKAEVMRMYAAQHAVMDGAQELAALAIRTCGGQSMLKSLPLERMYRDSRCGALMLPYTTEIMEDYLSIMTLYDMNEVDTIPSDEGLTRVSMWRPHADPSLQAAYAGSEN